LDAIAACPPGRPDRLVGEVFLDVGEAGDGAALHQRVTVRQRGVAEHGDAVAQRGGDLDWKIGKRSGQPGPE